jgi:hypothetical protein
MLEFLVIIGLGFLIFNVGRAYQLFEMRRTIRRIALENNVNLDDLLNSASDAELEEHNIVLVKTETVDDTILLYNVTTNEFLGQAKTIEEAARVFNERKQNTKGAVVHDDAELFFIDGKISKTL